MSTLSENEGSRADRGERVCLCILFNHPYLANLPILRRIYSDRFQNVRFLVPLARVEDEDVITVYRGSFAHNAYAVDAWPELRTIDCDHYLFVHDDVLISPGINETNLLEVLGMRSQDEGYIPHIQAMPRSIRTWGHFAGPLWRLIHSRNFLSGTGVDSLGTVLAQLPPVDEAMRKLSRFGAERETVLELRPPGDPLDHLQHFTSFGAHSVEREDAFREHYLRMLFNTEGGEGELTLPYPFVISGPSGDFYVVPKTAMPSFIHISGVLAAAGMFVEVAAPTALALACERVRTAAGAPVRFEWSMSWLTPEAVLADMRADPALVSAHPVKLSMVKDRDAFLAEVEALRDVPAGVAAELQRVAPGFDPRAYLEAHADVRAAGMSASLHYLHHGRAEGRALRRAAAAP